MNIAAMKYISIANYSIHVCIYDEKFTPEELAGFKDALIELCIKIDLSEFNTIDLCGTEEMEKTLSIFQHYPLSF
jgi:anthranilate phosphoribosyltransferase